MTRANGAAILCTSSLGLALNVFYYLEIGAKISATVGWVELRINNVLVASYYGSTGTNRGNANGNTAGSGNGTVRYVQHGGSVNSSTLNRQFDDIVINDDQGSVDNDFMGNVRVYGILPSGNGTNSGWTRTGGTASGNYTAVSENPIDGDTSYVSSAVVSTTDTYNYADIPANTAVVYAVCSYPIGRKTDVGARSIVTRVRSGGTEADASNAFALQATYTAGRHIMETNPVTTLAWSPSDVNGMELGPRLSV